MNIFVVSGSRNLKGQTAQACRQPPTSITRRRASFVDRYLLLTAKVSRV